MHLPDPSERPPGVPCGAVFIPPADDFEALRLFNASRPHKGRPVRVTVPFAAWRYHAVTLRDVHPRALSVSKRSWSMGRCLVWSDRSRQVPGVWAWLLEDEQVSS